MTTDAKELVPLCEDCGYALEGLAPDAACSECGRPVAHSLPAHRGGSPWQQLPSLSSWLMTNISVLLRPRATFAAIRIDDHCAASLLYLDALLAATLMQLPWMLTVAFNTTLTNGDLAFVVIGASNILLVVLVLHFVAGFLCLLSYIEYFGMRFISNRRGWRLTRAGAMQICCHAGAGWIVLGLFVLVAGIVGRFEAARVADLLYRVGVLSGSYPFSVRELVQTAISAIGFFIGLFTYELLVYVGVRQCRFAATAT